MVDIEWVSGVVRGGDTYEAWQRPYDFSATIVTRGTTAELLGLSGNLSLSSTKDLIKKLKALGFKRLLFERLRDGKFVKHEIDLIKMQHIRDGV